MLIDWFTVFAQIINFLILIWLLKKFLYKPILNAIDERENLVKAQLTSAQLKMQEAQEKSDLLSEEKEVFQNNQEAELSKAIDEAELIKISLIETAKKDIEEEKIRQSMHLKEEENYFKKDLIKKTQTEVFIIARKTLSDLASENLENHIVNALMQKLESLGQDERDKLVSAFKSTHRTILIRSTLELPKAQEIQIRKVFETILNDEVAFDFELNSNLVSGIEIITDGYKLSWNIDEYLTNMSKLTSTLSGKSNNA
jgi:F-type H+-transporting ATPase subunit b